METERYRTKAGKEQFLPVLTVSELDDIMSDACQGFCLACGNAQEGAEPDARRYICEGCGQPKVYGFEELMIMGLVKTTD